MTGAQERSYGRLRKDKKKANVKIVGERGSQVRVQWTEKTVFDEDRTVVAEINPGGLVIEEL